MAEPGAARRLKVAAVMGTAVRIDLRDADVPESAFDDAFTLLRDIDARFSTYRSDGEVSRLADGALPESGASLDVRQVLALCDGLFAATDGAFDARGHRSDGRLDPSGVVKGWALEEAALALDGAGARNYAVEGGGDIVVRGEPERGRRWRIGIRHPYQRDRVAAVLELRNSAVATSALYERGPHILDPMTHQAPSELVSVSVVGPSLAMADAFATAVFVMGTAGLAWLGRQDGYGVYAITADDRVTWSPVVGELLARAAA